LPDFPQLQLPNGDSFIQSFFDRDMINDVFPEVPVEDINESDISDSSDESENEDKIVDKKSELNNTLLEISSVDTPKPNGDRVDPDLSELIDDGKDLINALISLAMDTVVDVLPELEKEFDGTLSVKPTEIPAAITADATFGNTVDESPKAEDVQGDPLIDENFIKDEQGQDILG